MRTYTIAQNRPGLPPHRPRHARLRRSLSSTAVALALAATATSYGQTAPASSTAATAGSSSSDQIVQLSPFEVTAESNGYFQ